MWFTTNKQNYYEVDSVRSRKIGSEQSFLNYSIPQFNNSQKIKCLTAFDFFVQEKFDNYIDNKYVLQMSNAAIKYGELYSYDSEHCKYNKRNEQKPEFTNG